MSEHAPWPISLRIAHLPAYARLGLSIVSAVVAGLLLPTAWRQEVRFVAWWDGFALTALILVWFTFFSLEPQHIRKVAQVEDPSRTLSLALVVLGAGSALLAVLVLLQSTLDMQGPAKTWAIILALSAVVLGWTLIHTVFTLRYAHLYFGADPHPGGLTFPGDDDCPEYLDFAYFAFVIGMTAQTSDVTISGSRMRRNVLIHGVISFAFNTAVLALSIGVLSTLLSK